MALPVVAATFIGGLISGLVQFFTTKAGHILAGLGLSFIFAKGIERLTFYVVNDIRTIISLLNSGAGGGISYYEIMFNFAAYAGLFDAINILIGGVLSYVSVMQFKAILGRLK